MLERLGPVRELDLAPEGGRGLGPHGRDLGRERVDRGALGRLRDQDPGRRPGSHVQAEPVPVLESLRMDRRLEERDGKRGHDIVGRHARRSIPRDRRRGERPPGCDRAELLEELDLSPWDDRHHASLMARNATELAGFVRPEAVAGSVVPAELSRRIGRNPAG